MPSSDQDPCGHEQPADIEDLPYRTSSGRELTTTWLEAAANEAEEGYDPSQFRPRNVVAPVHHVHDTDEVTSGES